MKKIIVEKIKIITQLKSVYNLLEMNIKLNSDYEVLTPNGFKDFYGIKQTKNTYLKIILENNEEIGITYNHIFIDKHDNQIYAKDLNVGDTLVGLNGELSVVSITPIDIFTDVYDLIEVADGNIYYTNNILSHNCAFIGSGDNVIEGSIIRKQEEENVKEPVIKDKEWDSHLWIWELPQRGHRYIAGLDVSRGDSEDATGFCIIDYDTFEQVVEYHGKIPPDVAALLVEKYSKMYNALTTFDITGGMGIAATAKLKEMNFPKKLFHYDNLGDDNYFFTPTDDMIPGINFASRNRRSQIVAALEEAVARGDFKIRSQRLTNELKKFIYKNGKPDHMKGSHDDCLKEGTLIKTITGYKPIEEIKIGELVLTHMGRYRPVVNTLKKQFNGDWYEFNFSNQISLGLSYNHPLYGYKKNRVGNGGEFKWYFPSEWGIDKNGVYNEKYQYKPRQISIIEKFEKMDDFDLNYTDYFELNDNETNLKLKSIKVDKNFAKFLGLFLADGHAYKNSKKIDIYHITVAFNSNQKKLINETFNYLNNILGVKCKIIVEDGNSTIVKCSSKLLWYVLNECYDDERNKILPPYYLNMGDKLSLVLKYWLKGDGWVNKRDRCVIGCSISKKLALSMRDIAAGLGYNSQIRCVNRHRYGKPTKKQYWVTIGKYTNQSHNKLISDIYYGTKTVKIEKTTYIGDVYNLQVADDESFVANGIVVHNCIMALGMCLFVANTSFKKLHESDNATKAMLESWKIRDNEINTSTDYLLQDTINMARNTLYNDPQRVANNNNFKNTRDFGWLFGKFGR